MKPDIREVLESPIYQGASEQIAYQVTTTPWGETPTAVSVTVTDDAGTDVTATVMPTGSPSVAGDVITLPVLKALTDGTAYRVTVRFTAGGNIWESFFRVIGQE